MRPDIQFGPLGARKDQFCLPQRIHFVTQFTCRTPDPIHQDTAAATSNSARLVFRKHHDVEHVCMASRPGRSQQNATGSPAEEGQALRLQNDTEQFRSWGQTNTLTSRGECTEKTQIEASSKRGVLESPRVCSVAGRARQSGARTGACQFCRKAGVAREAVPFIRHGFGVRTDPLALPPRPIVDLSAQGHWKYNWCTFQPIQQPASEPSPLHRNDANISHPSASAAHPNASPPTVMPTKMQSLTIAVRGGRFPPRRIAQRST